MLKTDCGFLFPGKPSIDYPAECWENGSQIISCGEYCPHYYKLVEKTEEPKNDKMD